MSDAQFNAWAARFLARLEFNVRAAKRAVRAGDNTPSGYGRVGGHMRALAAHRAMLPPAVADVEGATE